MLTACRTAGRSVGRTWAPTACTFALAAVRIVVRIALAPHKWDQVLRTFALAAVRIVVRIALVPHKWEQVLRKSVRIVRSSLVLLFLIL